jgi:ABC-type lipoprotein export system ATPase subunit
VLVAKLFARIARDHNIAVIVASHDPIFADYAFSNVRLVAEELRNVG